MRTLLAGIDDEGRSAVVAVEELDAPGAEMVRHRLHSTEIAPPPPVPGGRAPHRDLGVDPGVATWVVVQWPPGQEAEMHHTDSIDYDTVLAGSLVLILDDGEHELGVGDCVVVAGVDHAWRAGPEGCTFSAVIVGTTRPA